jgi:CubicO group peptidase (beta-lactamase class C family)
LALLIFGTFNGAAEPSLKPDRLREIPKAMQKFVDDSVISGAVTWVARPGGTAAIDAVGFSDLANKKPMKVDALFWIASMTKPITAAAILMLVDEGKLSVEDPVEKHLPEFKGLWLATERTKEKVVLIPAPRSITIRDLLTHTSGLAEVPAPRPDSTLAEIVMAYSQQPLRFPPGSKWEYCNSGINTLGRIVEVVSGQKFADFLDKRIINPLGMKDTTFWPNATQAKRMAKSYKPSKDGKSLEETEVFILKTPVTDRQRMPIPAGGLYSTASDMGAFYEMMLNHGEYKGKRLLSESATHEMTRSQTGDLKTGFVDGMSWGFGFQVVKQPQGVTGATAAGTFGHGGAFATQSWADPSSNLIMILMIQRAGFPNGDNSPVRQVFQNAAEAAIVK